MTGRKLPLTLAFTVLVAVAFGASCRNFFVDPVLQSIAVGPVGVSIQTGNSNNQQQMSAVATYDDGTRPTNKVTWSVDDDSIATVTSGGLLKSLDKLGTVTVTATSTEVPTISGSTTVKVTVGCIQSIKVTPETPSVPVGDTIQLAAMATTCNIGDVDITDVATWTSSDTTIAP